MLRRIFRTLKSIFASRDPNVTSLARYHSFGILFTFAGLIVLLRGFDLKLSDWGIATITLSGFTGTMLAWGLRTGVLSNFLNQALSKKPQGRLFDILLPPEEADHRFVEIMEAFDRWVLKYGFRKAKALYNWQTLLVIVMYWFDKVVIRVLARK